VTFICIFWGPFFIELLNDNFLHFESTFNINSFDNYKYNFTVNDYFDNWLSVNAFIYNYCLE
jgi:hypothetical protein